MNEPSLFITEDELHALLRIDAVNGPGVVRALERLSVRYPFPKPKEPFDQRYRAAVIQWLDHFHSIRTAAGEYPVIDGREYPDVPSPKGRRRQDQSRQPAPTEHARFQVAPEPPPATADALHGQSLFISEAELYQLMRLGKTYGRPVVRALERFNPPRPEP